MIIGTVLYRQKYPSLQYVAAVLLSLGLTVFILADAETSPNFHPLGVLLISSALFADAFIGMVAFIYDIDWIPPLGTLIAVVCLFGFSPRKLSRISV